MNIKARKPFKARGLKDKRRRDVSAETTQFVSKELPLLSRSLPLMIQPAVKDIDLPEWAALNRDSLKQDLLKHGGLLFRNFGINSVSEMSAFASSMAGELYGEYGDLPTENKAEKVYKSTPYPADKSILFHNESSHMHQWPQYQFFYCVKASETGGETPLVDCRELYRALDPELAATFQQKGLMYLRNFNKGLDVSWQHFFQTEERSVVEDKCRRAGFQFEWIDEDSLRVRQFAPAVIRHPETGEFSFFNQIELHHPAFLAPEVRESLGKVYEEEAFPRHVFYGDGSHIPESVITTITKLYEDHAVALPWQDGDIIALDNMLVAHARWPFTGERKIVVAMGNMVQAQSLEPISQNHF